MGEVRFKYSHGDLVRDKVTGLEGVVLVCAEHAAGYHRYGVRPRMLKCAQTPEWVWLNQSQVELVAGGAWPPGWRRDR